MITQLEVYPYFVNELPRLLRRRIPVNLMSKKQLNAKAIIVAFSEYTRSLIIRRDLLKTQQCLAVIDQLYQDGDEAVRKLIENIYVSEFASFVLAAGKDRAFWENVIPDGLRRTYAKFGLNKNGPAPSDEAVDRESESEGDH